ncbi:MAG: MFS transporter [Coriobacteriia bacterium]|nr:MFS transporter [Coriobacteriia bacterium]
MTETPSNNATESTPEQLISVLRPVRGWRPLHVAVVLLLCASLVGLAFIVGKPLPAPFPLSTTLSNPAAVATSEDGRMAIVDSQEQRVLFLDANRQLLNYLVLGSPWSNQQVSHVFDVAVSGEDYYLAGLTYYEGTNYIENEKLLLYDARGNYKSTLYTLHHEKDDRTCTESMIAINVAEDGVNLLVHQYDSMTARHVAPDGTTSDLWKTTFTDLPYFAAYNDESSYAVVSTITGAVYLASDNVTELLFEDSTDSLISLAALVGENGMVFADQLRNSILYVDDQHAQALRIDLGANNPATYLSVNGNNIVWCERGSEAAVLFDATQPENKLIPYSGEISSLNDLLSQDSLSASHAHLTTITTVPYSLHFAASVLAKWTSLLCLLALAVVGVVVAIRNRKTHRALAAVRRNITALVSMCVLVACAVFFLTQIGTYQRDALDQRVESIAEFMSRTSPTTFGPDLEAAHVGSALSAEGFAESKQHLDTAKAYLDALCESSTSSGAALGYTLFSADENGNTYVAATYRSSDQVGCPQQEFPADQVKTMLSDNPPNVYSYSTENEQGRFQCSAVPVFSSQGNPVGILVLAGYTSAMDMALANNGVRLILTLLAIGCITYLVVVELRHFLRNRKQFLAAQARGEQRPETNMVRTYAIGVFSLMEFDSVVLVLASGSVLAASSFAGVNELTGLPVLCYGIGLVPGALTFRLLAKRFSIRRIVGATAVVEAALMAAVAGAAWSGTFVAFCVLEVVNGLLRSMLLSSANALVVRSTTQSERHERLEDLKHAELAASTLPVILAGFVAQYVGFGAAFLLGVVLSLALLTVLRYLPKSTHFTETEEAVTFDGPLHKELVHSARVNLRLLLTPALLVFFLCGVLPLAAIGGYAHYLFPLFATGGGAATASITTLVVLAHVFQYSVSGSVARALQRVNMWGVISICLAFAGLLLVGFLANHTFVWSLVVLVLIGIAAEVCYPALHLIWPRETRRRGFSDEQVLPLILTAENAATATRAALLGVFLTFGAFAGCVALGALLLAASLLFYLLTRRSNLAKSLPEAEEA